METSSRNKPAGGIVYICLAGVLWGTSGTALFFAPADSQASVFGILRLTITGLLLFCILYIQKSQRYRPGWNIPILLVASGSMAGMQFCFFNAVNLAGVAMGTTMFIGSYPIFAGILGLFVRKERPSIRWGGATLLSIVGVSLMSLGNVSTNNDPCGIVLALGAGACYAVYSVATKGLLAYRSAVSVMAMSSSLGALLLSPLLFVHDIGWLVRDIEVVLPLAVYLGIVTSVCPLLLFAKGLKKTPVATVATLNLIEPLTATLLGVIVLHETLPSMSWFGMCLLIFGVLWLTFPLYLFRRKQYSLVSGKF